MIHRFFIPGDLKESGSFELPQDIGYQLKTVLRLDRGEKIVLFNSSGYDFISEFDGKGSIKILEKVLNRREPDRKVFLFFSFLKKDNMEWVFEKGTEIGVSEFFPVLSARSIKKDFNKERAE